VRQIGPYNFTPSRITDTLLTEYEKLVRLSPADVAKITA
jgi:branched-chain amino acid aminotransferase